MMPETKLAAICCRPRPIPTPKAPPRTATAVRSMPMIDMRRRKAAPKMATSEALMASSRVAGLRSGWALM